MAPEENPYKTPEATIAAPPSSAQTGAWFQGNTLVVPIGGTVPTDRCARCTQPAQHIISKRFAWHPPGFYLVILLNLLIYIIVALATQKKGTLTFALCESCRSKRKKTMMTGHLIMVGAIAGSIYAFSSVQDGAGYGAALLILALVGAIVASIGSRTLQVEWITKEHMYFKKVPLNFLD